MQHLMAIVLAAGEGKRMKSNKIKVVHKVCGKPIIEWVYSAVKNSKINDCILVVGHKAEQVKACMGDRVSYAYQIEQLGTGHAVMQAMDYLKGKKGSVFVLSGDTPLISSETISNTLKYHEESSNAVTVVTAEVPDPTGYGRIVRNTDGSIKRIVEHRDASPEEKEINEINSGMYCFEISHLIEALNGLRNDNAQGEYYLTDTLEILIQKGLKVGARKVDDPDEILGINDRLQLAQASEVMKKRILSRHMQEGVTIIDPSSTYIDEEVQIGKDTVVYPGTFIEGKTVIGEECVIGSGSRIVSSTLGNNVEVNQSVIIESSIGHGTKVGPFAYVRPGSVVGEEVKIGDFVEIKKSTIGDQTKISHLTYVGDAEIGKNVNLGCGVVVVNYDGVKKSKTVVEDHAFIGCNVNLVSPVVIKEGAYVAAGSTITEEVPSNALAIARKKQVIKEDWVGKKGLNKRG